jgi:hypothetical protein
MNRKKFLRELKEIKERNLEDNLRFIELYAKFLKSKNNKEWSSEQKKFINSIYASLPKRISLSHNTGK